MSEFRKQLRAAFPPKPTFTETNVPELSGKVYIVTGSNTGVGLELAKILYGKNAKVYVAARSEEKSLAAIETVKAAHPASKGQAVFLHLDLADLSTIKATAQKFLAAESRLDVLFNNAGVMMCPTDLKTAQGLDLQLGTNCVGSFLLTKLLTPILVSTAAASPAGSVRVIWVSSSVAEVGSHNPGGVDMENLDYKKSNLSPSGRYGISKAGNYLHGCEYARRYKDAGIVSVPLNPGNLNTDLSRHLDPVSKTLIRWLLAHPPIYGAYTELFAGLSPEVGIEKSGAWVAPWGRFESIRPDLLQATKPESEGGTGNGLKFWEWTEEQVKPFL